MLGRFNAFHIFFIISHGPKPMRAASGSAEDATFLITLLLFFFYLIINAHMVYSINKSMTVVLTILPCSSKATKIPRHDIPDLMI